MLRLKRDRTITSYLETISDHAHAHDTLVSKTAVLS